jgi:hypothetical protein
MPVNSFTWVPATNAQTILRPDMKFHATIPGGCDVHSGPNRGCSMIYAIVQRIWFRLDVKLVT